MFYTYVHWLIKKTVHYDVQCWSSLAWCFLHSRLQRLILTGTRLCEVNVLLLDAWLFKTLHRFPLYLLYILCLVHVFFSSRNVRLFDP